ncbi:unnamed protein product, partial [Mycena citricolor]
NASRPGPVCGLTVLVCEHIMTFKEELRVIWRNKDTSMWSKVAFGINRYLVESVIALTVAAFSGEIRQMTTSYPIRPDHRYIEYLRSAKYVVLMSVILQPVTANLGAVLYSPLFRVCLLAATPRILIAVFAIQTSCDISVVILMIYNALDQPRRSDTDMKTTLRKDGVPFLVAIFGLRMLYTISAITMNPGQSVATVVQVIFCLIFSFRAEASSSICWSINCVVGLRLNLRLDALTLERKPLLPVPAPRIIPDDVQPCSRWWRR